MDEEDVASFAQDFGDPLIESDDDEYRSSVVSNKEDKQQKEHAGTNKKPKRLYSQLLGRYVDLNTCISCGASGHVARSALCPLYGRNKGKKNNFHTQGQTTPQQRATRLFLIFLNSLFRFAKWIINTFGLEFLKATGVLDIAGGQGKLSLDLQLRYGLSLLRKISFDFSRIACTIVDPRKMQLSVKQHQILEKKKNENTMQELPCQKVMLFEDDFLEDPENQSLFDKIGLIVGLHPDQATERIVRFGLKHQKSFAVLPCCVFPKMFPDRFNPDGTPVRHYEEFCDWLQSLDTGIQRATLPIPGRSIILYRVFKT